MMSSAISDKLTTPASSVSNVSSEFMMRTECIKSGDPASQVVSVGGFELLR
jgi:hypothetical protein